MTPPTTIAIAVERVHRMLDKLGIPNVADDARGWSHLTKRMKLVQMYMDGIRGKYLRSKKRERAMSAILNGPETKKKEATYSALSKKVAEYEDREKRIKAALTKHFEVSPNLAGRWPHELPRTIEYLVHRSNQLKESDSLEVKAERERTKDTVALARKAAEDARKKENETRRLLDYYISVFGLKKPPADWSWSETIMDSTQEAQNLVDAAIQDLAQPKVVSMGNPSPDRDRFMSWVKQEPAGYALNNASVVVGSNVFPYTRGNPFYLGDYPAQELVNEISTRMASSTVFFSTPNWDDINKRWVSR